MQREDVAQFPMPARLKDLIASGVWPSAPLGRQQFSPTIPESRVRQLAPEESVIVFYRPPFRTVARDIAADKTGWWGSFGAADQIMPEKAVIFGDFGLGAETMVVLDYARHPTNPPILRLRWGPDKRNDWIQCARDFEEFDAILGLSEALHNQPLQRTVAAEKHSWVQRLFGRGR